jgi:hypothetical protein
MNSDGYIPRGPRVVGARCKEEPAPCEGRHGWSFGGSLRAVCSCFLFGAVCYGWRGCATVFLVSPGTVAPG